MGLLVYWVIIVTGNAINFPQPWQNMLLLQWRVLWLAMVLHMKRLVTTWKISLRELVWKAWFFTNGSQRKEVYPNDHNHIQPQQTPLHKWLKDIHFILLADNVATECKKTECQGDRVPRDRVPRDRVPERVSAKETYCQERPSARRHTAKWYWVPRKTECQKARPLSTPRMKRRSVDRASSWLMLSLPLKWASIRLIRSLVCKAMLIFTPIQLPCS